MTLFGVRKLCLLYEKTKSVKIKARSGRKKCTSATDNTMIKRTRLKGRRILSDAVRREMHAIGISVSSRTGFWTKR